MSLRIKHITSKQEESLRTYMYKSIDKSILSNILFKRYTKFVLKYIPHNISANMLTFLGYFAMLINFVMILVNDINLSNRENWLPLLNAICLLFYFTMDNLDGSQARRLKQMSQLGQLLDHGVDSCVVFFSMIGLISTLKLGFTYTSIAVMLSVMYGFFYAGLEEKFTGVFELGYISGPTEGLMLIVFIHLFSAFYEQKCDTIVQYITYNSDLSRIFWFIHVSPLFLLAVFVFTYNIITSFIKSIRHRKKHKLITVIASYLLPCTLIYPLIVIHIRFIDEVGYQMINFIIFAKIFSSRYIDELLSNMLNINSWCISSSLILYLLSFVMKYYKSDTLCRIHIFVLFLFSIYRYFIFVYRAMFYCKRILKINILFNNKF